MQTGRNNRLSTGLAARLAAARAEDRIGIRALKCYQEVIRPASPSKAQMAALGNRIRRSASLEDAKSKVSDFLTKQMKKLEKREKEGSKPTGWRSRVGRDPNQQAAGEVIKHWIDTGRYLADTRQPDSQRLTPSLPMLQCFWNRVETLFRFHLHPPADDAPAINEEIRP